MHLRIKKNNGRSFYFFLKLEAKNDTQLQAHLQKSNK